MRLAFVHDYLTQRGGAERVALTISLGLASGKLRTLLYEPERTFPEFRDLEISTSRLQKLPTALRDPRLLAPMLPLALGDLAVHSHTFDVLLASSSGWAHGTPSEVPAVVYCHTPPRWIHEPNDYGVGAGNMSRLAIQFSRALKRWDRNAAARAATYVANSRNTATRIRRAYGLTAHVLPPPPGVTPDGPQTPVLEVAGDYFLTVGRPRGYKNTQALIAAFEAYGRERLVVVGGPPDRQTQTSFAGITFLEDVTDGQLRWLYANCLGLLAMGREDFGLTPVEAAGFGKPTLALAAGGYLETVLPGRTGVLIDEASPHAIQGGLEAIMRTSWSTAEIEHHGKSFSAEHFCQELKTICERAIVEP